jgi:hypothetical protein
MGGDKICNFYEAYPADPSYKICVERVNSWRKCYLRIIKYDPDKPSSIPPTRLQKQE